MSRPIALLLQSVLLLIAPAGIATADGGLSPEKLAALHSVTAVAVSPDGSRIAFLRSVPRLAAADPGGAHSHLYVVRRDGGGERRLVGGERRLREIAWHPDGGSLTFLDKRAGDEHSQIYVLPMNGGEPYRLFEAETEVRAYRWRPDGKGVAYTRSDELPENAQMGREQGFEVKVVDMAWTHTSLHLWRSGERASVRLTDGVSVGDFEWSPDGTRLVAALAPTPLVDDSYVGQRLHLVHVAGPKVERLVENPGKLGHFAWSPDGSRVAYVSAVDRRDPHAGMLYVVHAETKEVLSLTDGLEGMVHHVLWKDGDTLLLCVSRGVRTRLEGLRVSGRQWLTAAPPGPAFRSFSASRDGRTVAVAGSTASHPSEVLVLGGGEWERRTVSNAWLADVRLGRQEVVAYPASDGVEIEALLLYPVGYEQGRRYPLVIVAHGGPEAHFDDGWNTSYSRWGQMLCARGYFALYPNYRGSTGRGVAFAKADHGDQGGKQFQDLLDGIDYLDGAGRIDSARVGIGGGSYGGYLSAWAATKHSSRFAAAVSFVPVVELVTKWYTTDIPYEFYHVHYEEKWPHEQLEFLRERSPVTYAARCRTPLLLLGGSSDTRVDPSQPLMLYRAVKFATDTPVRCVQYPGEGHGNRKNVYRYDYSVRSLRWFDHYLRPGNHRGDPPPDRDIDYVGWLRTSEKVD